MLPRIFTSRVVIGGRVDDSAAQFDWNTRMLQFGRPTDQKNAAFDARRRELGVADEVAEIEGLTRAMLVKLGENDIKTLEDFAGCASDDLLGYVENKGNERVRVPGALDGFDLAADEVNGIIMKARVKAGWVKEEDLVKPQADAVEGAPEA